jgi:hypothetical protein
MGFLTEDFIAIFVVFEPDEFHPLGHAVGGHDVESDISGFLQIITGSCSAFAEKLNLGTPASKDNGYLIQQLFFRV